MADLAHRSFTNRNVTCSVGQNNQRDGRQWDGTWGIAGTQVQRFYLSDVSYGGVTHLFVIVIYADDPADMETFLPECERLVASVRVPATPPETRFILQRAPFAEEEHEWIGVASV